MSMSADVTYTVVEFCRKHKLSFDDAVELLADIRNDLEWDYGDSTESALATAKSRVQSRWEEYDI